MLGYTGAPTAALAASGSVSWPVLNAHGNRKFEAGTAEKFDGDTDSRTQAGQCVGSLCQYLNNKGRWVQVGSDVLRASTSRLAERRLGFSNLDSQNTLGWPKPGSPAQTSPSSMSWPDEQGGVQAGKSHWDWPNAPKAAKSNADSGTGSPKVGNSGRAQAEIRKEAFRDAVRIVKQQLFCQLRSCGSLEHVPAQNSGTRRLSRLQLFDDAASKEQKEDKQLSKEWNKVMNGIGSGEDGGMYIPAGDAPPVLNPEPDKSKLQEPPSSFFPHGIVIKEGKPKPVPKPNPFWPFGEQPKFPAAGSPKEHVAADVKHVHGLGKEDQDKHRSNGPIFGGGALANHALPQQSSLHSLGAGAHMRTNSVVRDEESERQAQAEAAQTAQDIVKELASKDLAPASNSGRKHTARAEGPRSRQDKAREEEDRIIEQSAAAAAEKIVERMATKDIARSLHIEKEAQIIANNGGDQRQRQRPAPGVAKQAAGAKTAPTYEQVKQQAEQILEKNARMLQRYRREQDSIDHPPLRPAARPEAPAGAGAAVRAAPTHRAAEERASGPASKGAGDGKAQAPREAPTDTAHQKQKHDEAAAGQVGGERAVSHRQVQQVETVSDDTVAAATVADAEARPAAPRAGHRISMSPPAAGGHALQGEPRKEAGVEDDVVRAKDMDAGVDEEAQQEAASRLARSVVAVASDPAALHGTGDGKPTSKSELNSNSASKESIERQPTPLGKGGMRLTFVLVGTNDKQLNRNQLKGFQSQAALRAISFGDKPKVLPTVSQPVAKPIPGLDSVVTLQIDMHLPQDAACVSALRRLAAWTRPDEDLLPLTPLRDAGPPAVRLVKVEGCPAFSGSARLMQPHKTDTLAMQGTLRHMQRQELRLQAKVSAYARQEHREEARQQRTLQREERIENELKSRQAGKAREVAETKGSARVRPTSAVEQVHHVLQEEALARRPAEGRASKAAKEEQALKHDVEKRAHEQGEARKKLQELEGTVWSDETRTYLALHTATLNELATHGQQTDMSRLAAASFNKVAAKADSKAAFKSAGVATKSTATAEAAHAQSESAQEASFLKDIRKFVSGKGDHQRGQTHADAPAPSPSSAVESTADFITGAHQRGSSRARPHVALPSPSRGAEGKKDQGRSADSIVDKALAAAGISSKSLEATGISLPSAHAPSDAPASPISPTGPAASASQASSGSAEAAPAPTTGALGQGNSKPDSADASAIVDKALAVAGIREGAAQAAPAPGSSPRGDKPEAVSADADADANAIIGKALGAAGISLPSDSLGALAPAAAPSPATTSRAQQSPDPSQAGSSEASGGGGGAAEAATSAAPSSSSLVEKQQHEIQSALQLEEAKLHRVQQRINQQQAARQQALSRAGECAGHASGAASCCWCASEAVGTRG